MLRWSHSAVRVLLGRSEARRGQIRVDPWWPRRIQKNVVQVASGRRTCPAFCPALYRGRFLMPQGGPRGVFPAGPKDFQKSVV